MDNSNSNLPNNPTSSPLGGTTPPPALDPAVSPWATPNPVAEESSFPSPVTPPQPAAPAPWDQPATNPISSPADTAPSPWAPPTTPEPAPIQPDPISTTTPTADTASPAVNPWSSIPASPQPQLQPEPVQSQPYPAPQAPVDPVPTWSAPAPVEPISTQPAPEPAPVQQAPEPAPSQLESAPTDLSHLISNNAQPEMQSTPSPSDTLVVPPVSNPAVDTPNLPIEHKGIPKWLIGVGAGLLIIVIGASAYFIMGVGQPTDTTSLPATESTQSNQISTPAPIITPIPQSDNSGTSNFGDLGGSATPTPQASSAADLMR